MRSWLYLLMTSGCGFSTGGGGAAAIDSQVPSDAGPDATLIASDGGLDASFCYGSGFGKLCLDTPPAGPLTLADPVINTDSGCTQVTAGACVLAGTTIDVPSGASVRALGSRPLVLVATGTLTITGTIGASSLTAGPMPGAGATTAQCTALVAAAADAGGGAGGAGGSFGGKGGAGGTGDQNDSGEPDGNAPGQLAANPFVPTAVRAGCAGGGGGNGVGAAGAAGSGGGAIYFIAGTSITIAATGRIFAVGQGGLPGTLLGGGGGGGSGGLVAFDAPMITSAGTIMANGGGGGEGGGVDSTGAPGSDGVANGQPAPGGTGNPGGNGGNGSSINTANGIAGQSVNEGGGGGGGGAGFIYVKGTFVQGASTISPSPSVTP